MLYTNSTRIIDDTNDLLATRTNLKSLLLSYKNELLGDPYFGTNVLKSIFNQNNYTLIDILIDDFYVAIATFMPQLIVSRNDIEIIQDVKTVYVRIKATHKADFKTNLYNIALFDLDGQI